MVARDSREEEIGRVAVLYRYGTLEECVNTSDWGGVTLSGSLACSLIVAGPSRASSECHMTVGGSQAVACWVEAASDITSLEAAGPSATRPWAVPRSILSWSAVGFSAPFQGQASGVLALLIGTWTSLVLPHSTLPRYLPIILAYHLSQNWTRFVNNLERLYRKSTLTTLTFFPSQYSLFMSHSLSSVTSTN